MDIKLNARLSAYSKVNTLDPNQLPLPTGGNAGDVLGIDNKGEYTLIDCVTNESIDSLFTGQITEPVSVKKDDIDTLFTDDSDVEIVSKSAIDSLFN